MDPPPRGPDWMPITPKTGSLFHADSHADHRSRGVQVVDHYLVVVVKFQCRVKAVEVTALNRTAFCCSRAKRFSLRMYSASADGTVPIASAMR